MAAAIAPVAPAPAPAAAAAAAAVVIAAEVDDAPASAAASATSPAPAPASAAAADTADAELDTADFESAVAYLTPSKLKRLWLASARRHFEDGKDLVDGTDTDKDQEARDTLAEFVKCIYPLWYNGAKPTTRKCLWCAKRDRLCIEFCDPKTDTWRCLWYTFENGVNPPVSQPSPSPLPPSKPAVKKPRAAPKRKAPSPATSEKAPGARPAAAAAASAAAAAAGAGAGAEARTPEHQPASSGTDESPLKKRRVTASPKAPKAPKAAAVVKSKAAPTGLAALLTEYLPTLSYDAMNVIAGYAVYHCESGFCTGSIETHMFAMCPWCISALCYCRACWRVHENTDRHKTAQSEGEELRMLNTQMGKHHVSLTVARAARHAMLEGQRVRQIALKKEQVKQRRREQRAANKVAAAAAAAAAAIREAQEAEEAANATEADMDDDAPVM